MVSSNDASKQNTAGTDILGRSGRPGTFGGGLGFLHISSKGLVHSDLVRPLVLWGSVQAVCVFGVLKPC